VLLREDNQVAGRLLSIRESTFLSNPRTLAAGQLSRAVVLAGRPSCGDCAEVVSGPGSDKYIMLPERLTAERLEQLLQPYLSQFRWAARAGLAGCQAHRAHQAVALHARLLNLE
jgi:hypothetical protein